MANGADPFDNHRFDSDRDRFDRDRDRFDREVAASARRHLGPSAHYRARTRRLVTARGSVAELRPLWRQLADQPHHRWKGAIDDHLTALARAEAELTRTSLADPGPLWDRVGLQTRSGPSTVGRIGLVLGPGVMAAVVIALEHLTVPVTDEQCRKWGSSPEEVTARAIRRTRQQSVVDLSCLLTHTLPATHRPEARPADTDAPGPGAAVFTAIAGGPFTSGLAMDPTRYSAPADRSPTLLAVAHDHHTLLAVAPADLPAGPDVPDAALTRWARLLVELADPEHRHDRPLLLAYRPSIGLAMFTST